jgi:hypothetical protein
MASLIAVPACATLLDVAAAPVLASGALRVADALPHAADRIIDSLSLPN